MFYYLLFLFALMLGLLALLITRPTRTHASFASEMVIFTGDLSNDDREAIEYHIGAKYGLAIKH